MSSLAKIQEIFYSGSHAFTGNKDVANEIAFLIDNNYLNLEKHIVCSKKEYLNLLQKIITEKHKYYTAEGGSNEHIALKKLAEKFLQKHRKQDALFEQAFCGYYPDVISKDKKIVIECGNTQNPEKIYPYFRQGNIEECIQIPYPDRNDVAVMAYSFTAGKHLQNFLEDLEENKQKKALDIIKQRGRKS